MAQEPLVELTGPAVLGDRRLRGAPMLVALAGYGDAGRIAEQVRETLLGELTHETLARFDTDLLHDYRARRPHVRFAEHRFERMDAPELTLHALQDPLGRWFTLLSGPEPDLQWRRFVDAVASLAGQLETSLVMDVTGIPMPVPHTRPHLVTPHGSRTDLIDTAEPHRWPIVEMSSSAGQQLEITLGELGVDTLGLSVHVPQYLADARLPQVAVSAFEHVSAATGLTLPTDRLRDETRETLARIEEQVDGSPEIQAVIGQLEQRYDAAVDGARPQSLLAGDAADLPDADEIGAAAEAFLAHHDDGDLPDSGRGGPLA